MGGRWHAGVSGRDAAVRASDVEPGQHGVLRCSGDSSGCLTSSVVDCIGRAGQEPIWPSERAVGEAGARRPARLRQTPSRRGQVGAVTGDSAWMSQAPSAGSRFWVLGSISPSSVHQLLDPGRPFRCAASVSSAEGFALTKERGCEVEEEVGDRFWHRCWPAGAAGCGGGGVQPAHGSVNRTVTPG
jgi:hypothetical protein